MPTRSERDMGARNREQLETLLRRKDRLLLQVEICDAVDAMLERQDPFWVKFLRPMLLQDVQAFTQSEVWNEELDGTGVLLARERARRSNEILLAVQNYAGQRDKFQAEAEETGRKIESLKAGTGGRKA